jgi:hypothetical protein
MQVLLCNMRAVFHGLIMMYSAGKPIGLIYLLMQGNGRRSQATEGINLNVGNKARIAIIVGTCA